jgi:1,4-dihydroxy-2-naphthoate octaprenyltransferase
MNTSIKAWTSALRPRTLFLAVATAGCGSGLACATGYFRNSVCILTLLTAVFLQLTSNLANDLGDYQHGADSTGERIGPQRAVQSGAISPRQMKFAIGTTTLLSVISGLGLLYKASSFIPAGTIILFIVLGGASIAAAVKYTAGKNPYGYKGLGDIFSFVFFGLVSVVGAYFLHTHQLDFRPWLPATGMGFFTVAVLNINNMRDMENDKSAGKITVASRLGFRKAKIYHRLLTFGGIACFAGYSLLYSTAWYQYLYMLVFALFLKILSGIINTTSKRLLDPYLKYTSLTTFLLSVAFSVCINL